MDIFFPKSAGEARPEIAEAMSETSHGGEAITGREADGILDTVTESLMEHERETADELFPSLKDEPRAESMVRQVIAPAIVGEGVLPDRPTGMAALSESVSRLGAGISPVRDEAAHVLTGLRAGAEALDNPINRDALDWIIETTEAQAGNVSQARRMILDTQRALPELMDALAASEHSDAGDYLQRLSAAKAILDAALAE